MRLRPWSLALLMLLSCSVIFVALEWRRQSRDFSDAALLSRLPDTEGTIAYLNVSALRASGLLDMIAGSRTNEEPEYQAFVRTTGFDYRDNLDSVLANLRSDASLFLLRGRFSWEQIGEYLRANEGKCLNGVCWMEVRKGRYLSVMPLAPDVMALGVGNNKGVVYEAQEVRPGKAKWGVPKEPFWVRFSAGQLSEPGSLPEGTRAFASAVRGARNVVLGVAPEGQGLEARMRAEFDSAKEAADRRAELEKATELLRSFFARDRQQPSPTDLSGLLTVGRFEQQQTDVNGFWPLDRTILQRLVAGL